MTPINTTPLRQWITDLACLGLILFVFYAAWLGSYALFTPDEGRYCEIAREMIATHDYITPRLNGIAFLDKPILYYWFQTVALHLFGINEWSCRLFPATIGIVGCLMTYLSGRILFNRRSGLLAALILATSPLYFAGAHYANMDLEVAVWISATLLCFIIGVQSEGRLRTILLISAYLFSALAFLTKGLIGIAFPAMICGAWIIALWRWKTLLKIHLFTGLMLFVLLVLPWYILVQRANPEFLHFFFVTQQVSRFLSAGEFNNPTPIWFYIPVILIGMMPWTGFVVQSLYRTLRSIAQDRNQHASALFLILWVAIVLIFFSIPHSKTVTYILPVFPPLALLIGHTLSDKWERVAQPGIMIGIAVMALASTGIGILMLYIVYYANLDLLPDLFPYLKIMAAITFSAAILYLLVIRKKIIYAFSISLACNACLLLTVIQGADILNQTTAKPLVRELQRVLQPQDEVISYFKFYQDVPFYLQKRILIANNWNSPLIPETDNWARELWYGMPFQKYDTWLIDEDMFWQHWDGTNRVFAFVNENYLDQFKLRATHYYFLDRYRDIILLSNQPTLLN